MEKRIVDFLIKAKKATYAGKGAEISSSRAGSHDLVYREENLMYYDTYLGGEKFAGEEALWISEVPYWSMNYVGRVTGDNFSGDFLKEALLRVPEDNPYRGPLLYENGDYTYRCEVNGTFEWFQGYETISYKGEQIYDCYYHGGMIVSQVAGVTGVGSMIVHLPALCVGVLMAVLFRKTIKGYFDI